MVSGHFDPVHDVHLAYIKLAAVFGDHLICVVTSDEQAVLKKRKVNVPEQGRVELMDTLLKGLSISHTVMVNHWDKDTTYVAQALKAIHPDIFFRGSDKTQSDMPESEKQVCDELGIEVYYMESKIQRHGSEFV